MYVNGKVRPIESIPVMGGVEVKEKDGGSELNYDIL
jgi:vacuolar-type H+-ATPase subunit E/Vma4